MKAELRTKIKESNKAVKLLKEAGHVPQGVTKDMKNVVVMVNGKMLRFTDYIEAAKELLN